jgi:hypothetical protein
MSSESGKSMTVPKTRKVYDGPTCGDFGGKKRRTDDPCTQAAGWGTDHAGTGRCKLHSGANTGRPIEHGKYSRYDVIKSAEVKRLREHFEADPDPLNLLPDVLELRVRIADFCNRYDEYTEALLDWHASWTGEWDKAVEDWREEYRDWHAQYSELLDRVRDIRKNDRALTELEDPPVPPEPGDMAQKPRKVVDILQAGQFLGMVGGLIDKINRQETEGKITLLDVQHILKNYGLVALQAIEAEVEDDDLRERLLVALDEGWDAIPIAKRERGSKIDI